MAHATSLSLLLLVFLLLFGKRAAMKNIGILGYNPLNARDIHRKLDIAAETENFNFVIIVGTGQKRLDDIEYEKTHVNKRMYIHTGFVNESGSNKSCGIGILLHRKLKEKTSRECGSPQLPFQAGGLR